MRVLLDENLPWDLIGLLPGHEVMTVQGLGWAGIENGELLRRASGQCDAFLTMDRKLEFERDLTKLPFGTVVILARSNRMVDLTPLVARILETLGPLRPGEVRRVGA